MQRSVLVITSPISCTHGEPLKEYHLSVLHILGLGWTQYLSISYKICIQNPSSCQWAHGYDVALLNASLGSVMFSES